MRFPRSSFYNPIAMNPSSTSVEPTPQRNPARRKALVGVAALVVVGAIAYGVWWALVLNHYESTDNAYVQGNMVQLTPQQGGTVVAINANDTDHVKAGQWLVRLDPSDARVALDGAEAQLARTVREVRGLYASNSALAAQISLREADLQRAQSDLQRARDDVARRAPLVASGAVGQEEFNHAKAQVDAARSGVAAAQSAVRAAREQSEANRSLTDGVAVAQHPSVLQAAAKVREAFLALGRSELRAPVDGYVARRNVQLGQRVPAGAPLMSVIALDGVWVEANFKESQLRQLRIGQPVELVADVYGDKVPYHGRIEGLGAGTGAAFALLPAQNATGNWIKVVQRIPVRVRLEAKDLAAHPLRVGLSMQAKVDVSVTDGPMLAAAGSAPSTLSAQVLDSDVDAADAEVDRIIATNAGQLTAAPPAARKAGGARAARRAIPPAGPLASAADVPH